MTRTHIFAAAFLVFSVPTALAVPPAGGPGKGKSSAAPGRRKATTG
jgi:hypothetical protein